VVVLLRLNDSRCAGPEPQRGRPQPLGAVPRRLFDKNYSRFDEYQPYFNDKAKVIDALRSVGRPVLIVVDEILNYVGNGLDGAETSSSSRRTWGSCSALGKGIIPPAQEVLTTEHRFSWQYMMSLCLESPTVPEAHETLWGNGLALGLARNYGAAVSVLVPRGRA
jgi:hypothetical protein